MGANNSSIELQGYEPEFKKFHDFDESNYMALNNNTVENKIRNFDVEKAVENTAFRDISDYGYSAVWSLRSVNSPYPTQRIGHASAYDPQTDKMYIAYGISDEKKPLSDIWELDLKSLLWRRIPTKGQTSPRAGARMVIVGSKLWIYGGFHNKEYFSDLHTVDIYTGEIERPQTTGDQPLKCSGHTMSLVNRKILLFGGYGNGLAVQCRILDIDTLHWDSIKTSECKFSHAACVVNGQVYLFGGSKTSGMLRIDVEKKKIFSITSKGPTPSTILTKISLVQVSNNVIALFGRPPTTEKEFSHVPAFNTCTKEWFNLPILPDGYSTTLTDGEVGHDGLFKIPICSDTTAIYRPREREIVLSQGKPFLKPPMLAVFSVSEASAAINEQNDMIAMLH